MSQPYAIKSRISDESHSTKGLQGVPIRKVSEVKDGDVLMVRDGEWVATSETDGYSGNASGVSRGDSLGGMSDVSVSGINEGEILGYDGNRWVNVEDQKLSEADVDAIVSAQGYLKEIGANAISEGEYNQIKGIGGTIKTDPYIQLKDDVVVDGGLSVVGDIGSSAVSGTKSVCTRDDD